MILWLSDQYLDFTHEALDDILVVNTYVGFVPVVVAYYIVFLVEILIDVFVDFLHGSCTRACEPGSLRLSIHKNTAPYCEFCLLVFHPAATLLQAECFASIGKNDDENMRNYK